MKLLGLIEYNFCAYQKDIEFSLLRLSMVNIAYILLKVATFEFKGWFNLLFKSTLVS